jgi:hypothetical protein
VEIIKPTIMGEENAGKILPPKNCLVWGTCRLLLSPIGKFLYQLHAWPSNIPVNVEQQWAATWHQRQNREKPLKLLTIFILDCLIPQWYLELVWILNPKTCLSHQQIYPKKNFYSLAVLKHSRGQVGFAGILNG